MESRRTDPWIPVGHPDFKWTSGADVQATWRKDGWVPTSETRPPVAVENKEPAWVAMRRVK
jgi:hypothetical protein